MKKQLVIPGLLLLTLFPLILTACQRADSRFVGSYQAVLPSTTTDGRRVTLTLNDDNTAVLTNDYMDGQTPVRETGTWDSTEDTVVVVLTDSGDEPLEQEVEITFQLFEDRLFVMDFEPEDYFPSAGLQLKKL
jgi:uncharacterized lipoprotein NlpE involved in copper resistance